MTSVVCMFCGQGIEDSGDDHLVVSIRHPEVSGSGEYWCHDECLIAAVHQTVPLYVLGIVRDAKVMGKRP